MILRLIRPPGDVVEYHQELIEDRGNLIVSKFTFEDLDAPTIIGGKEVVANGYHAILFEFFEPPLEILKIHDRDANLTGYYCNINSKPSRFEGGYEIIDLFIDVFVFPDMRYEILDEMEFETAVREGWITPEQENLARRTVDRLVTEIKASEFPPEVVRDFHV